MYVCICRQVTDHEIRDVCREGASSLSELREKLGVASDCGKCGKLARPSSKNTRSRLHLSAQRSF